MTDYRLRDWYHELVNDIEQIKHEIAEKNNYRSDSIAYYSMEHLHNKLCDLYHQEDNLIIQRENELLKLKMQVETHQKVMLKDANFQHCVSCGLKIPLESNYCEHCGVKIE